ncbi:Nitrogen assimilation regulatory protein [Pirellulimonas nuda]|uniref:DNA-binding transcriptional regulator NtrC n=1 Tax=Pirellulimonas nuda TaxID=2528009 RepID=A0A518DA35_9BACT|nr:sigma-54 dependent transcriptional regulator [Pirellulimonas nuda]QDU88286.1 Nitrogen assimilation regulatory protein [Pirellulimonas nuda]
MPYKLLVIDDDRAVLHLVERSLSNLDLEFVTALSASDGIDKIESEKPDVVLLDIMLPDLSGLEAFTRIRQADARLPVIFITAASASDVAIEAMKLGAFDYVCKPIDVGQLDRLVRQALESRRLMSVPVGMRDLLAPDDKGDAFVGRCRPMQDIFKAIGRVAPQNVAVLIRGESGTGKELVARAVYQHSNRSEGPFLAVNCAALSETLLESELFGHEKGAFTGAHERRIGKFEQCSGGTIFLDEVGDMSPLVQGKVLRLLQEQKFERVGGNQTISTDVRIVSATNRDLEEMCQNNEFRTDLYYRLNGYTINLPPLRDRGDDRVMLLEHTLARLNAELGRDVQGIAPEALKRLLSYDWPGNVRELQTLLRQAVLQSSGPVLLADALPAEINPSPVRARATESHGSAPAPMSDEDREGDSDAGIDAFVDQRLQEGATDLYATTLSHMERSLLSRVLRHAGGNQSEAARILGITRGSLRNKIRANQISIGPTISVAEAADV